MQLEYEWSAELATQNDRMLYSQSAAGPYYLLAGNFIGHMNFQRKDHHIRGSVSVHSMIERKYGCTIYSNTVLHHTVLSHNIMTSVFFDACTHSFYNALYVLVL